MQYKTTIANTPSPNRMADLAVFAELVNFVRFWPRMAGDGQCAYSLPGDDQGSKQAILRQCWDSVSTVSGLCQEKSVVETINWVK